MEKYLVVVKDLDDTGTHLFGREGLVGFLRDNLIEEHYSGDGYRIEAIYRFDGGDKLALLELDATFTRDAGDDFIDYGYRVCEPGTGTTVTTFTVRIDGRA